MSETQELEYYLMNQFPGEERLIMEARLLLEPSLYEKASWQQNTYELVKQYGRKKIKEEIELVQKRMFSEKRFENFRQKISSIFRKNL